MKPSRQFKKKPPKDAQDFAAFRDIWIRNLLLMSVDNVSSGAKIVGVRLAMYMHQDQQYAFPSYAALSEAVGMGERIVQKHTVALETVGFIHVDRRRNAGNYYFLDAFWDKSAKRKKPKPDDVSRINIRLPSS